MKTIRGAITALITPFDEAGQPDYRAFSEFVEYQIREGIHGVVPCGTTGESATLDYEEHVNVIAACVEAAAGRVPVIAGTGSNSTAEAVMLTRRAEEAGADAVLVVTPYYNKPCQEGMFRHFKAVHDSCGIPVVLYNVPGRCGVDLRTETVVRLAALERVIGLKDASGDLERPAALREKLAEHCPGKRFVQLSGNDGSTLAFNIQGGTGCISVTSNVAPGMMAAAQEAFARGELAEAVRIDSLLRPLHEALFCAPSPGPAKYAGKLLGRHGASLRLPLVEPDDAARRKVEDALRFAGFRF